MDLLCLGACFLQGILPAGGLVGVSPGGQSGGLHGDAGSQTLAVRAEESLLL